MSLTKYFGLLHSEAWTQTIIHFDYKELYSIEKYKKMP